MAYTLKQTRQFQHDLVDLRTKPEIHAQLEQVFEWLEEDPRLHQASLQSHRLQRNRDEKLWKSRVTSNYRLLWGYGDDSDIILARVGEHDFVDYEASVTDLNIATLVQRPRRDATTATQRPSVTPAWKNNAPTIFGRVHPNVLRLLGVPEAEVSEVLKLTNINKIFELQLPAHVADTLVDLCTRDDCTLDELMLGNRVLYRATADQLAGYCKGELKQLLLNLTPEQEKHVSLNSNGPVLIKGVAGSGKTTVGLRKAMEERRRMGVFGSELRVMFTTFTETLARSVKQMFEEQYGAQRASEVEVSVLRDWLKAYAGDVVVGFSSQLGSCLATAISNVKPKSADSFIWRMNGFQEFLKAEIENVIKGRNLKTFEQYVAAKRTGRAQGLQRPARKVVWEVYEAYQAVLRDKGLIDYLDLAIRALEQLETQPTGGFFDVVIVDEAQDLRPVELQAVRKLCRGRNGSGLILLGDAAQTLYYRGVSWVDAGINIRGRTYELKRNFRNSRQILEAAWSLIQAGGEAADSLGGDLIEPDRTSKSGPLPVIRCSSTVTDQQASVVDEIVRLCQQLNVRPGDIAILAPRKDLVNSIRARLDWVMIPCVHFRDNDFNVFENGVKLITIHSSKGLEFPVVFVVGLTEGELPRALPAATPKATEETDVSDSQLSDRQLLYVAMTRAAHRLYLIGDSTKPSRFLGEIDAEKVSVYPVA